MKWDEARVKELLHIMFYDEMASEEDKRSAGKALFKQIGVDRDALKLQGVGMQEVCE